MNHIAEVIPEPGHRVRIRFADGTSGVADLGSLVNAGGVFASLRDETLFRQVRVGPRGRSLEWPNEIDLCADALRLQVQGLYQAAS